VAAASTLSVLCPPQLLQMRPESGVTAGHEHRAADVVGAQECVSVFDDCRTRVSASDLINQPHPDQPTDHDHGEC
jgi:hypothetical protein